MDRTLVLDGPGETTGASGTLNFVSLAEVLVYIEKQSDGGTQDALLQKLIDSVSRGAFGEMNGRFLKRPATAFDYVFTPDTEAILFLPQYPVGTLSAVEFGYMASGSWVSSYQLTADDYDIDLETGRIYGSWSSGRHSVRVTWTGGFADAPEDAKEAAAKWVGIKLQRLRVARWDVTFKSVVGAESNSYAPELTPDVARVWAKYSTPLGSIA